MTKFSMSKLLLLIFLPCFSFSADSWISYEQHFGALNNKFITIGGATGGFIVEDHLLIGAAVHGSYGYKDNSSTSLDLIYGGGVLGFQTDDINDLVSFRLMATIGGGSFYRYSSNPIPSFMVAPSAYADFFLTKKLALSVGFIYRYFETVPTNIDFQHSFAGSVALSWFHD